MKNPQTKMNRILTAIRDRGCRTSVEVAMELEMPTTEASIFMRHLMTMGLIEYCGDYPKMAGDTGPALKMYEPTEKAMDIPPYDENQPGVREIQQEEKSKMVELRAQGLLIKDIATQFGLSQSKVCNILKEAA